MGVARTLINANVRLSRLIDSLLPPRVREDGHTWFIEELLPRAFQKGITLYDLGGGSRPCISRVDKERYNMTVVGLDVSAEELAAAPPGIYDRMIVVDLCKFVGHGEADAVICQAVLEHVPDTPQAMRAIASALRAGGRAFIFAPSANALFARLNLALPENVKRQLLFAFFPQKAEGHDGFKAYYNHCTPRQIEVLAEENQLEVEERRLFWVSSYFTIFTPAFVLWRFWQLLAYLAFRDNAAEFFVYILQKRDKPPGGGPAATASLPCDV
jgi:2-polyprenyl-6-hydroxyphenyl methylase/3-demethylubiquinone-9 3-methyltransferase